MDGKHKHITRIDQESKKTHGYYVRVSFRNKQHSKFFSDKKHGGPSSALLAAIANRDKVRCKWGMPFTNRHLVSVSNSNTGVVGVRLNEKKNRYEISWVTPQGIQKKTSVSILKHGKEEAFARACTLRRARESERLTA